MINLGLTTAETADLVDTLLSPHRVEIRLYVLDMSGRTLREVSGRILDGSWDLDTDGDVSRSVSLVLMDVDGDLGYEFEEPVEGGVLPTRMIRVYYGVQRFAPGSRLYSIPIFTGPIMTAARESGIVTLECQGKEALSAEETWRAYTWPAGWKRVDVIRHALTANSGERSFLLQDHPNRLGSNYSLEAGIDLFAKMQELARGIGMHLFYDGMGRAVLREKPREPIFTFDTRVVTSEPDSKFNLSDLVNSVRVIGGTPKGYTGKYTYEAFPDPSHPLSPQSLAINGVHRIFPQIIEDDTLDTTAAIQQAARLALLDGLTYSYDTEFTSLVIPFLEEMDMFRVNTPSFFGDRFFKKASIPLVGDGEMSVGFLSTSSQGPSTVRGTYLNTLVREKAKPKNKKKRRKKNRKGKNRKRKKRR